MRSVAFGLALAVLASTAPEAGAAGLDIAAVNQADLGAKPVKEINPAIIKAQVLLDRARFSPGVIDGRGGGNVDKALAAFQAARGLEPSGRLDDATFARLAEDAAAVLVEYEITKDDVNGPFTENIPAKMEDMAGLKRLGYRGPRELLAEKFHMDQDLLRALNPGRNFDRAGTTIVVAAVKAEKPEEKSKARSKDRSPAKSETKVASIEIDKNARWLKAFGKDGTLIAFYPASVGSEEKPAPTGTFTVKAIAVNPTYEYNPDYAFKGVRTKERFTVAPGPNNPVGVVWIDLSAESYGIHGTPEPAHIGKTESHGCIRLTNWDVRALAQMVEKGASVILRE